MTRRTDRLNSLLREVISDVIRHKVKNPNINELTTVTRVSITKDLRHAKVYISVIGEEKEQEETLKALHQSSGFISTHASKLVVMRFFPELKFTLDDSSEQHAHIEKLLKQVHTEREERNTNDDD